MMVKLEFTFNNRAAKQRTVLVTPIFIEPYGRELDQVEVSFETRITRESVSVDIDFATLEKAFRDAGRKGEPFVDLTPSGVRELKDRYSFRPDF